MLMFRRPINEIDRSSVRRQFPSLRGHEIELPQRSPRALLSGVRSKLTLVKFFSPPEGWRKRFIPSN